MSIYLETAKQAFYAPMKVASTIGSQVSQAASYGKMYAQAFIHIKAFTYSSAWYFSHLIVLLAQEGKARSIESYHFTDLSLFLYQIHWTNFFSPSSLPTVARVVCVVNDRELIMKGLEKGRKSDRYDPYPTIFDLDPQIGSHNMLFSTSAGHRDLRSPLETLFKERNFIRDYLPILAEQIWYTTHEPLEQLKGYSWRQWVSKLKATPIDVLKKDVQDKVSHFPEREKASTIALIDEASVITLGSTMGFMSQLLYDHPESCQKILMEWQEKFGELSDEPSKINLDHLIEFVKEESLSPYLHAFVMEVSRLYPATPQIIRIAKEDFSLGDREIHAGEVVVFNIMGCQRDAIIWENPTEFIPERFFNEDSLSLTKGLLLNFGLSKSPERCLGQELAKYSLLLRAATLALREAIKQKDSESMIPSSKKSIPEYRLSPPFIVPKIV